MIFKRAAERMHDSIQNSGGKDTKQTAGTLRNAAEQHEIPTENNCKKTKKNSDSIPRKIVLNQCKVLPTAFRENTTLV